MEALKRVFGVSTDKDWSQVPEHPELLMSSPYSLLKPELDKTYPKVKDNTIEEAFKLSFIDSRNPFDEFDYL